MKFLCTIAGVFMLLTGALASCYYAPATRRDKADPSFMSEAEAESLIHKKLAPYGIKFVYNMKLRRDGATFIADGYDRDLRVGYEYRSHEGMDFEGEPNQNKDGLTEAEIEALREREKTFREYFLIIPEGPREGVEEAVDKFVENLYAWEVLKKVKKKKSTADSLFPDKKDSAKDVLPWEATGDLKKKRKEMEAKEELDGKPTKSGGDDDWSNLDKSDDDGEWGGSGTTEEKGTDKGKDVEKGSDEEVDEEDF